MPLGDSIYWYNVGQEYYGQRFFNRIKSAFPNIDIIINNHNTMPHRRMPRIYKKCFVVLRLVDHDGFSQTCAEAGLMGRISIWNNKTTFSRQYKDIDEVIEIIRELKKGYNYKLISSLAKNYILENEKKWLKIIQQYQ